MVMLLLEAFARGVPVRFDFTATDISGRVLERCRKGLYSQLEVQRGLPVTHLLKYFEKVEEGPNGSNPGWQLKSEVRNRVQFEKLNLLEPWAIVGPFDWIFCRNVLIYQNVENKRKIIERMVNLLNTGGFLILGAAESMVGLSEAFEPAQFGSAILYRKK
mgnify:FL=1